MKRILLILTVSVFSVSLAQLSPPKKGVVIPPGFSEYMNTIRNDYSKGYYAEKFRERKNTRELISHGMLDESMLAEDTVYALTLMGDYPNLSGHYTNPEFQSHLYDGPNPTGTVTDYYAEVSYDQLLFTGDAKGWYTLPRTLEDYVGNNNGLGPQGGPRFVWELIQAAETTVNYADYIQYYDGQGNPHIGFIAVVHAGAGAEAGANNIWSHRWTFTVYSNQPYISSDIDPVSGENIIIDGNYAIMPERSGGNNNSGNIIEIGVFAHEFGHIFGLPDLYDTDNSSEGLGNWCLMAGGSWGGDNSSPQTPVHMSAWCKMQLGWVTPVNITTYEDALSVPNAEENPVAYRMWRDGSVTLQYFLIENRQKIGFDINIRDAGFLIFHVDETQSGNQNENHYLVDLEQADGNRDLNHGLNRGDPGDPFPGVTQNNRFDWNTNPNSKDYNLMDTYVSVRNITRTGTMMIGDFEVGPRSGAYAFADPVTIDFGDVEVGTNSIIKPATLTNYGDQDLIIDDIPLESGDFKLETLLQFPITLSTFDSLTLGFRFIPTTTGNISEQYPVSSNDTGFTGYTLTGYSFQNYPALDKTFYASSGEQNNGGIMTIDPLSGEGTLLGPSLFDEIKSISIDPATGAIYGLISNTGNADLVKVNAGGGDSHILFTMDLQQMAGIAFDTTGTLFGISRTGNIYTLDKENGTYSLVIDAEGTYSGIAFNPVTNELWGTSANVFGSNVDLVFKVNLTTGDTTGVGHTGLGKRTNDIVFDEDGDLFGVIGSESELNDFVSIDTSTGIGTIIGSLGFKHILGLAYEETGVTDVEEETNNNKLPEDFILKQNYPNPFNPVTKIKYGIPNNSFVEIRIYNMLGSEIATLVNEDKPAGNYEAVFNASNLASGIYFYRMRADNYSMTRKMILLK